MTNYTNNIRESECVHLTAEEEYHYREKLYHCNDSSNSNNNNTIEDNKTTNIEEYMLCNKDEDNSDDEVDNLIDEASSSNSQASFHTESIMQRLFGLANMSTSQRRTCMFLTLCVICGVLLFVFIGIPFIVFYALTHRNDMKHVNLLNDVGAYWNDNMIKAIVNSRAVLDTFHAYVRSLMNYMPSTNSSWTNEVINESTRIVSSRFSTIAGLVLTTLSYAAEIQIAPRGVITIIEPADKVNYYRNMFNSSDPYFAYPPTPEEIFTSGTLSYIGPYRPPEGRLASL